MRIHISMFLLACCIVTAMVFLTPVLSTKADEPAPKPNAWGEPEVTNQERAQRSPGNYQALTVIGQFTDGIREKRPQLNGAAFPFQFDSDIYASQAEYDDIMAGMEKNADKPGSLQNKFRSYNFNVREIRFYELEANADQPANAESCGLNRRGLERLKAVRARHSERAVLVRLDMLFESLQSTKVEGVGKDGSIYWRWLLLVKKEGDWRVVWFDK